MSVKVNFSSGQPVTFPTADSYEINDGFVRVFQTRPDGPDIQLGAVAPGWRDILVEHPAPPAK